MKFYKPSTLISTSFPFSKLFKGISSRLRLELVTSNFQEKIIVKSKIESILDMEY